VKLDAPVDVTITAVADPSGLVRDIALLHRRKGEANFQRIDLPRPEIGEAVTLTLPAVTAEEAAPDVEGLVGALIEVAVVGYDARGWEVYAGPAPARPLEVPVGYILPVPWYAQWWVWGIVGGVAVTAVTTTSAIIVTRFWPKPDTVNAPYEVGR